MKQVAILGTGLIGATLGLAIGRLRPSWIRIGYDRAEVLSVARRCGAIDEPATSAEEAVREADLVLLATPLRAMEALIEELAPHLRPGTLLTDTGSVKAPLLHHVRQHLPASVYFLGGHPLAGSERPGPEHADPQRLEGAFYVLCPRDEESWRASGFFLELLLEIGLRLLRLDPETHDRIVAITSHLPQLVATVLMQTTGELCREEEPILAGGGLRDMTRIADSPFTIWRDILEQNRPAVLSALSAFVRHMERLYSELEFRSWRAIEARFEQARNHRSALRTEPASPASAALQVELPIRCGFLEALLACLGEQQPVGLQLQGRADNRLLYLRFPGEPEARNARERLLEAGYRVSAP